MNDNLLKPVDDGLPMRKSNNYAQTKLRIIEGFVVRFITSMRNKWPALYYIDLFAGPGKNRFPDDSVMLGSPLISLIAKHTFTHYRFIEADPVNCRALAERSQASARESRVQILRGDCNILVNDVVNEIRAFDNRQQHGSRSSLNLAILDPEGLELEWTTVEKLGRLNRMDLIINFSTSGITRNARRAVKTGQTDRIDSFFGTNEWQEIYVSAPQDSTHKRRALLDFYKSRLHDLLKYKTIKTTEDEAVFHNNRNVQVYTLIGASKHELGMNFWVDSVRTVTQPRLL
ncbi:MAG: three-Cys-motif partner protein TcmP [Anaerolineaceae bacterium]|nr:three-Cys-motif partner protein TcmP [Anaerolineaceae bacterium]